MNIPVLTPCIRSDLGSLRGRKTKLELVVWTSGIIVDLSPDDWLDITDPSAALPPAYVVDAASKRGRE